MPKISVIVPVYKVEKYLNRCVDSILSQTFTDFELILVDDGSPDNCGRICDEYAGLDKRIVVIHKENGGLSDARNAGIDWVFAHSNSEWITFIDSDDWVHIQYLELLYKAVVDYDVCISSCGFIRTDSFSELEQKAFIGDVKMIVDSPEALLRQGLNYNQYNIIISCSRLYKKNLFNDIRFPVGRIHEDEFTTYKLIYKCDKVCVLRVGLYCYFRNQESIMHSGISNKKYNDKLNALVDRCDYFYNNNYFNSLDNSFELLCLTLFFINETNNRRDYNAIIDYASAEIKRMDSNYKNYIPQLAKKYGYYSCIKGQPFKKEMIKSDFITIKQQKGVVFAVLWAIKNYFKS